MLLAIALLIALPLGSLCQPSQERQREMARAMLEQMYKPCIVHNRNCPADGSMNLDKFSGTVRNLIEMRAPPECKCDISSESCTRRCYYAFMMKLHMNSVSAGKTPAEAEKARKTQKAFLERYYKPCVMENRNCEMIQGFSYEKISAETQGFMKMYDLPDECDCDPDKERCIRQCYYSYLEKMYLANRQ